MGCDPFEDVLHFYLAPAVFLEHDFSLGGAGLWNRHNEGGFQPTPPLAVSTKKTVGQITVS